MSDTQPTAVGLNLVPPATVPKSRLKPTPCDVTGCNNPSTWVDAGDAGDIYLCSGHMRP